MRIPLESLHPAWFPNFELMSSWNSPEASRLSLLLWTVPKSGLARRWASQMLQPDYSSSQYAPAHQPYRGVAHIASKSTSIHGCSRARFHARAAHSRLPRGEVNPDISGAGALQGPQPRRTVLHPARLHARQHADRGAARGCGAVLAEWWDALRRMERSRGRMELHVMAVLAGWSGQVGHFLVLMRTETSRAEDAVARVASRMAVGTPVIH
ncbi:hypothetical protein DFH09DRAFT_1215058 [Mycena vulgaris]|nr:hypothetical protein DFH09DRAFT_1215058 [Mycena vulgaris]